MSEIDYESIAKENHRKCIDAYVEILKVEREIENLKELNSVLENSYINSEMNLQSLLEEKREREQGCEYCDKDVMSGNPIITKHSDGYVGNCNFSGYLVAKLCPMCGRRLNHE